MQARPIRRRPSSSSLSAEPQGVAQTTLTLHLPCGGMRRGEDARAAARREFREEVAIEVSPEGLSGPDRLAFVDKGRSIMG